MNNTRNTDNKLVSCLCLTRNRVPLLRRAVGCFLNQSYAPRELIIVFREDDLATRKYLSTLSNPAIRLVEVPSSPILTTGQLRNKSLVEARGHYVAIWDDDDWHGPTRLAEQICAMRQTGRAGCVLLSLILYDEQTQSAFLSAKRAWEGSLVAERESVPFYPELQRGEDTPVIVSMRNEMKLASLERPNLYIYVCHSANTWDKTHWNTNIWPHAQALSAIDTAKVHAVLTENYA